MLSITPTVRNLLILNLLFFVVDSKLGLSGSLALRPVLSSGFMPFQFISYMFLHADFGHLFSNMFGLFMFGPLLEREWGPKKFLFFYFFTGIGAGLLFSGIGYFENTMLRNAIDVYIQSPSPDALVDFLSKHAKGLYEANLEFVNAFEENPTNSHYIQSSIQLVNITYDAVINQPMVGASGAIFGILMAFGLLYPNMELFMLFIPFPIKAKYFVTFYGLYELYSGIKNAPSDNVAHFAHIGGMLFAYILLRYWATKKTNY
ncbi:rhomboid family intramembrane serine protease [Dyadobacter psychrotolerans]|uniref:Rhomboid family intramembrane serine protease n=1 Tax=Dyadobacter psychrotolerans TaxID=2541721 RepID=A0A4R5DKL8_9BACT|nr:rhomboid family intramembrane serine protease [Dyadobacter psychrotolerans]TDE13947.1 rhomboid family intramembrane serine protease [Dyadobacter psychrotolerans]